MGTYSFNTFCPRCGYPAYVEGHSRSPEESLFCRFCGYSTGSMVDCEKLVEGQPPPEPEKYEHKSAGAYYIQNKTGGVAWGHVKNKDNGPVDWEKIINWFQEILRDPDVDSGGSYLTKWDDETKKLINLIGHPTMIIFDECPEDCPEDCFERYGENHPEKCPKTCLPGARTTLTTEEDSTSVIEDMLNRLKQEIAARNAKISKRIS